VGGVGGRCLLGVVFSLSKVSLSLVVGVSCLTALAALVLAAAENATALLLIGDSLGVLAGCRLLRSR